MDVNENLENKKIKKTRITLITFLIVILLIISSLGITYAYFYYTTSNSSGVSGSSDYACSEQITYTKGQDIAGRLTMGSTYTSGEYVDVKAKVASGCSTMLGTLYLNTREESSMDFTDNALRYTVVVDSAVVSEGAVSGLDKQIIYANFPITTTEKTYRVYIWLDASKEDLTNFDIEIYNGFIDADARMESTIADYAMETLVKLGLDDEVNDTVLTSFTGISTNEDTGIYKTEDDLGTSYYFRGNVENNYVKFGENSSGSDMYWRIIRINGDGTIRMIYDGTQAYDNGVSSEDRQVGTSAFNSSYDGNVYVGYMYGSAGASTYASTHTNTNNSIIKIFLEGDIEPGGWYKTNIIDTGYSSYVADAIYCNDRSLSTLKVSYTGVGTTKTYYASHQRNVVYSTATPSLKCTREEDRFTTTSTLGNKKNIYPVGLITMDEMVFAGGFYNDTNTSFYLYTGNDYWTMSPYYFETYAACFGVDGGGHLYNYFVSQTKGVRPAISLKADAITGGSGTASAPFRVE